MVNRRSKCYENKTKIFEKCFIKIQFNKAEILSANTILQSLKERNIIPLHNKNVRL